MPFEVGNIILLSKGYFEDSQFITQFYPGLAAGIPYQIIEVVEPFEGAIGISRLQNPETGDVFDINEFQELEDYWCFVDPDDKYRIVG